MIPNDVRTTIFPVIEKISKAAYVKWWSHRIEEVYSGMYDHIRGFMLVGARLAGQS